MGKRNDEEILFELSHLFVLFHYGWKHIVLSFPISNTHLLYRLSIGKDVISLHSLALITHHIALNLRLVLCNSWLDYRCYVFTNFPLRILWMLLFVLLLHLSGHFNLSTAHEDVMLYWSVDPAYSLNSKWLSDLVNNFLFFFIIKNLKSVHITILGWLINPFNIQSYTLRIVWILTVIAIKIANPLSHTVISLPLVNESLYFVKIHKTDKVYMSISLPV